ncbi:MAG: EmrB/QacA family drug resistance transporter, partial [Novosphingobium sp.]|nr:EmrB/QacA family drug resistance transporter [Novosphingobium sp.]
AVLYPVIIARVDVRVVVACAALLSATTSMMSSRATADWVGDNFTLPLFVLGFGIVFSAIPLQQAALSAVEVENAGEVTSMFNIARNVGGSIGLAAIASLMDQRLELHHWRINEQLRANDPATQERLDQLGIISGGGPDGFDNALRMLDGWIMHEALVMSFADIFTILAFLSLLAAPLVLLLDPIDPERAKGMVH